MQIKKNGMALDKIGCPSLINGNVIIPANIISEKNIIPITRINNFMQQK